ESEQVQPAECGCVLVLLTDGLAKDIDLHLSRFLRQLPRGDPLAAVGMQRVKQTYGEAARTSKSGRVGKIADDADVDGWLDLEQSEALACDVIANRVDLPNRLAR